MRTVAPITIFRGGDDTGWGVSAAYQSGPIKVGATYLDTGLRGPFPVGGRAENVYSRPRLEDRRAPTALQAQWAHAGDVKGNSTVGVAQGANGGLDPSGGGTGGDRGRSRMPTASRNGRA